MEYARILKIAYQLATALQSDERILKLNEFEKQLDANPMIRQYSQLMKEKLAIYLNFDEGDIQQKEAQKQLHLAKKQLDELEEVRQYYQLYQVVRLIYDNLQQKIFGPFNVAFCHKQ